MPLSHSAIACIWWFNQQTARHMRMQAANGTGAKRMLNPEEEAKKKKRMERFGIVDEKAEAAKRAEAEVV